jgi:hypothetical protein
MLLKAVACALVAQCPTSAVRSAEYSLPACLAGPPVTIVVRIGAQTLPRRAWLHGGTSPPLQIIDAETSQPIWSAAAMPPASQQFAGLRAQFVNSLLPLDLDGDGTHDRLYAGDLAGRLWRFDLHPGLPAEQWATGGIFADLSLGLPRGFVAAPDVSLSVSSVSDPAWFNIALGTARLGDVAVDNRFYVMRDRFPFESWTQSQYDRWRPLREIDLAPLPRLGATLSAPAPDGYYISLGGAQVLSPTLTVSGRATLALIEPGSGVGPNCSIAAVVSSIDLNTASEQAATTQGYHPLQTSVSMRAGEPFTLQRAGSRVSCMVGEQPIPACDVDLSPQRTWWRREDAD